MKIVYAQRDVTACGYYRQELPHETISQHNAANVTRITHLSSDEVAIDAIRNADIFVVPRPREEEWLSIMRACKKKGIKVVVDYDDIYDNNVHPFNPGYAWCGTEEVIMKTEEGEEVILWQDGMRDFDIHKNKKNLERYYEGLKIADMVTCTQEVLADEFRKYNPNVKVLPNCVDGHFWSNRPQLAPHEGTRILWTGGGSHYQDLVMLREVFPEIVKQYPDVTFVIYGELFQGVFRNIPKEKVEFHSWTTVSAYPFQMQLLDADFAIIPLEDNTFNRNKSNIKWVENSFLKTPCVMSDLTPYKEEYNGNNMVLVANSDEAWIRGISLMIESPELKKQIGLNAYDTVKMKYDINVQFVQWLEAYKGLLDGKSES